MDGWLSCTVDLPRFVAPRSMINLAESTQILVTLASLVPSITLGPIDRTWVTPGLHLSPFLFPGCFWPSRSCIRTPDLTFIFLRRPFPPRLWRTFISFSINRFLWEWVYWMRDLFFYMRQLCFCRGIVLLRGVMWW